MSLTNFGYQSVSKALLHHDTNLPQLLKEMLVDSDHKSETFLSHFLLILCALVPVYVLGPLWPSQAILQLSVCESFR